MKLRKVLLLFVLLLFGIVASIPANAEDTALDKYVNAADPSYHWEVASNAGNTTVLNLTSQTWQNIKWQHKVTIVRPKRDEFPEKALLLISFGGNTEQNNLLKMLADSSGLTVVGLSKIPNQPLWERSEDALIAYTFQKFIDTGDDTWPLLLPMTKSVIKTMDAVQEYSKSAIAQFIVGGASKRGWTTWLTGAADKRVVGIVPMVYDNLNLPEQMKHQKEMLGEYSSQIGDYTELNLPEKIASEEGQKLVKIVDPYNYLDRLTMPKLIINGSNDPYWTVDSLNLYYDDLKGAKNVFYIPNAGHSMNAEKGMAGVVYLMGTIRDWACIVAAEKQPPQVSLNVEDEADGKKFIAALPNARSAELWVAQSSTKDFRKSEWKTVTMQKNGDRFEGSVKTPEDGYIAVFAQLTIPENPMLPLRLSTPVTWWQADQT